MFDITKHNGIIPEIPLSQLLELRGKQAMKDAQRDFNSFQQSLAQPKHTFANLNLDSVGEISNNELFNKGDLHG